MFDKGDSINEIIMIVATGMLVYKKMITQKMGTYLPPTKEEVRHEYLNDPLFNKAVDTIVSRIKNVKQ